VAECSTAILPGLPALPWTALTPLTFTLDACLGPVTTFVVPFALLAPFALPPAPPFALLALLLPFPGLLERADDELTPPQPLDNEDEDEDEDDDDDDDDDEDDEDDDDEQEDDDNDDDDVDDD